VRGSRVSFESATPSAFSADPSPRPSPRKRGEGAAAEADGGRFYLTLPPEYPHVPQIQLSRP